MQNEDPMVTWEEADGIIEDALYKQTEDHGGEKIIPTIQKSGVQAHQTTQDELEIL